MRVIEQGAREHQFVMVSIRQPAFTLFWKSGKGRQFFRARLQTVPAGCGSAGYIVVT